ncbi:hypothetical protein JOL79_07975 [Microbispora sp. RL4-1S]|uniref:Condensation domain-containing protein n=1 Tax=Microbispora oryzae TaxID=2806554 RepID=A0A941API5_9ACTN|nr:condensation domain-containing protein [Microbispora oryzae]MBP2703739.1 hypothetical protein [Microbispora oryzae]
MTNQAPSPIAPTALPLSLQHTENMPAGFAASTNVPIVAARFGDGLCPDRLARAFASVVARHEALRLRFVSGPGGPAGQVIAAAGAVVRDSLPGVTDDAEVTAEFERILRDPMDLASDGPVISRIYRLGDGGHAALFAVSHVAADGWSAGVLRRDISRLYLRPPDGALPALEEDYYSRHMPAQRRPGETLTARQAGFFRSSLRGVPALPARRGPDTSPVPAYRYAGRRLADADASAVFDLARRLRTTPAKILMAAAFLALRDYFGRDSFGVLDVGAARSRGQADWVGLLSKGVPVPVRARDDMTAGGFVADVHRQSLQALHMINEPYTLKRVLTLLHGTGESDMASALYRRFWTDEAPSSHSVMFNCLTVPPAPAAPFGPDVAVRPLFPRVPQAPQKSRISDLDVLPVIEGTSITVAVAAHPGVHDAADVERVLSSFERVLIRWARDWDGDAPLSRFR